MESPMEDPINTNLTHEAMMRLRAAHFRAVTTEAAVKHCGVVMVATRDLALAADLLDSAADRLEGEGH